MTEFSFDKLQEMKMTQKEFAKLTGIAESTISDWRKKNTNPTAEKIMIICKVLGVTPEWLLSGVEQRGKRGNKLNWYAIDSSTDLGRIVSTYNSLDSEMQERVLGYVEAIKDMQNSK